MNPVEGVQTDPNRALRVQEIQDVKVAQEGEVVCLFSISGGERARRRYNATCGTLLHVSISREDTAKKVRNVHSIIQEKLQSVVGGVGFGLSSVPVEPSLSHGVLMLILRVHPCLFASRALELMSAQFLSLILM